MNFQKGDNYIVAESGEAPSCNLARIGGGISRGGPWSHFKVELRTPDFFFKRPIFESANPAVLSFTCQ